MVLVSSYSTDEATKPQAAEMTWTRLQREHEVAPIMDTSLVSFDPRSLCFCTFLSQRDRKDMRVVFCLVCHLQVPLWVPHTVCAPSALSTSHPSSLAVPVMAGCTALGGNSWLFRSAHWCVPVFSSSTRIDSSWLLAELWKWKLKFYLNPNYKTRAEELKQGP